MPAGCVRCCEGTTTLESPLNVRSEEGPSEGGRVTLGLPLVSLSHGGPLLAASVSTRESSVAILAEEPGRSALASKRW